MPDDDTEEYAVCFECEGWAPPCETSGCDTK